MNIFAKRTAPTIEVPEIDPPAFLRAQGQGGELFSSLPSLPPRRPDPLSPRAASLMSEVVLKSAEAYVDTMLAEALRYRNEAEAYYNETKEWGDREIELARERASELASKHANMRDARDRFMQVPGAGQPIVSDADFDAAVKVVAMADAAAAPAPTEFYCAKRFNGGIACETQCNHCADMAEAEAHTA